jgi:hypothetical protein
MQVTIRTTVAVIKLHISRPRKNTTARSDHPSVQKGLLQLINGALLIVTVAVRTLTVVTSYWRPLALSD